jgi:cation diffusion facilitator family transporter
MFWCFRVSEAPPDANHPYGHGQAEHLSVGLEGGMILLAGLAVAWQAVMALVHGSSPGQLDVGLWLVGAAAAINLALGLWLLAVGRRTRSAILVADGQHVLSDVWTSVGVLAGVGVMALVADPRWRTAIDGLLAVGIAAFLAWTAFGLIRRSLAGLMDEADQARIAQVVAALDEIREPEWLDVHNLRLRASGDQVFVDFHLTVPSEWTIHRAHAAADRIEEHLLRRLGAQGTVLVHFDYPHRDGERDPLPAGEIRPIPLTVALATRPKG